MTKITRYKNGTIIEPKNRWCVVTENFDRELYLDFVSFVFYTSRNQAREAAKELGVVVKKVSEVTYTTNG